MWRAWRTGARTAESRRLGGLVKKIHDEDPDKGFRRIRDDLACYYGAPVNDKWAPRICRSLGVPVHHQIGPQTRRIWRKMC